jgi:pimeloyl-ACP methyl ester carboxylesterase
MIQGSGCDTIVRTGSGGTYSTFFNLLPFAGEGRFTVLAVEKPFAGMAPGSENGTAKGCSREFNADFTAESWAVALEAAVAAARHLPWVDHKRTLLFGVSEGAGMAALLAGRDKNVTDVVSIGGSGTTQIYDFIIGSYRDCPDDVPPCVAEVEKQVRAIAADPDSSTSFAWGHPFRRWTSFFKLDPAESLLRSRARVYLAFGLEDRSVPPLAQELTAARLLSQGRDVTVRRVPGAGHGLMAPNAPDFNSLDKETRAALDWFWQASSKPRGRNMID